MKRTTLALVVYVGIACGREEVPSADLNTQDVSSVFTEPAESFVGHWQVSRLEPESSHQLQLTLTPDGKQWFGQQLAHLAAEASATQAADPQAAILGWLSPPERPCFNRSVRPWLGLSNTPVHRTRLRRAADRQTRSAVG